MSGEFGNDYITLEDENGVKMEFEHIDTLELEDETYVALVPVYDDPNEAVEADGELVIMKIVVDEESGDELLATIEDEREFEEVRSIMVERLEEFYDVEN
ncbi:MAG: DUF1292 domain-containing protein [Eubacteriales bacterium]